MSARNGWQQVKFGDVVHNVSESVADPVSAGIERAVGLEHLEPGELNVTRWAATSDGLTFTRHFRAGHVLFGRRRAYQRKVAVADFDGVCSGDIYVLEPSSERVAADLLPFIVQSEPFFQYALRTSAGSLSPRTKWTDLKNYEFDLPPIEEQREMAALLWAAEDDVRSRGKLLHGIDAVEKEAVQSLTHLPVGELSVGGVTRIARSGGTPRRDEPEFFTGTIPWVKSGEVADGVSQSSEQITSNALESCSAWRVPPGSVLIAMYGDGETRGRVGFSAAEITTNQAVLALVPDAEKADARFLFHWMRSRRSVLRSVSGGANQKNLSKQIIVSQPLPILGLDEQVRLATRLDGLIAASRAVGRAVSASRALMQTLTRTSLSERSVDVH